MRPLAENSTSPSSLYSCAANTGALTRSNPSARREGVTRLPRPGHRSAAGSGWAIGKARPTSPLSQAPRDRSVSRDAVAGADLGTKRMVSRVKVSREDDVVVRARVTLGGQPLGEEPVQGGSELDHRLARGGGNRGGLRRG